MERIPVAVLGATGAVGQHFVSLLAGHPWFRIASLAGSERRSGQRYGDAVQWVIQGDPPTEVRDMVLSPLEPNLDARLVFSALPASVAKDTEPRFASAGYAVCSNASAFRYDPCVPLVIPEVNPGHLDLLNRQRTERNWSGLLVTSPNCTTTGLVMALKPLHDAFGLKRVVVVSLQALSGAGYPGVPSLDIIDNVVPYIEGEEDKIERETRLLLGPLAGSRRIEADIVVSAQANRVAVLDGHTICVSAGFADKPTAEQAIRALNGFRVPNHVASLPSAPQHPIQVRLEADRPQPRRDRNAGNSLTVTVGRVRSCPILDLRFVALVHNTRRGGAGGAVLNGELLVQQGWVK
jgi:aspartate-semialdehyde dehydrogenase